MTKTAEKTETKTETKITLDDVRATARKSALAYVGLYGLAYERAQLRLDQLKTGTGTLVETLIKRGEVIEEKGLELTKDARAKATELRKETVETVSKVVPLDKVMNRADRRVEELEAEVKTLNKKIKALSKKAATPRATTTKTQTAKTAKKAA